MTVTLVLAHPLERYVTPVIARRRDLAPQCAGSNLRIERRFVDRQRKTGVMPGVRPHGWLRRSGTALHGPQRDAHRGDRKNELGLDQARGDARDGRTPHTVTEWMKG